MVSRSGGLSALTVILVLFLFTACASQTSQTSPVVTQEVAQQQPEPAAAEMVIDYDSLARDTQTYLENLEAIRIFYEDVYFDYNRADLKPPAVAELERKAEWLRRHRQVKVIIEGHCDERGSNEHNLGLGEKRAGAIKSFLIEQGIDPARLTTISYGEERPVDERHTEEAWAKNRRGHLALP